MHDGYANVFLKELPAAATGCVGEDPVAWLGYEEEEQQRKNKGLPHSWIFPGIICFVNLVGFSLSGCVELVCFI